MIREYQKIMLSGKEVAVICVKRKEVGGELVERLPSFAEKFLKRDDCEFIPATPEDFLAYYRRKNGEPVSVSE